MNAYADNTDLKEKMMETLSSDMSSGESSFCVYGEDDDNDDDLNWDKNYY